MKFLRRTVHVWKFAEIGCEVHIPNGVMNSMRRYARRRSPNETGGTLVGTYSADKTIAHVEKSLSVRTGEISTPTSFYRPPDNEDGQIERIFESTEGQQYYLGEWHSHVASTPKTSKRDIDSLMNIAKSGRTNTITPILMIIGRLHGEKLSTTCIIGRADGSWFQGEYSLEESERRSTKSSKRYSSSQSPSPWNIGN